MSINYEQSANNNLSFSHLLKSLDEENSFSDFSRKNNQLGESTYKVNYNFNLPNLEIKEDKDSNIEENESNIGKMEVINQLVKDENKSIMKDESIKHEDNDSEERPNKSLIIILKRLIETIKNGEKLDTKMLFDIMDYLLDAYKKEMEKILPKVDNMSANEVNRIVIIGDIGLLLIKIKEFKTKEIDKGIKDKNEISDLKVQIILTGENVGIKEMSNKIKSEVGDIAEPIRELNIAIKIFILYLLEENYKILVNEEEYENIEKETKKINILQKKRKRISSPLTDKDKNKIKNCRITGDNCLCMLKRNLIQKIFLNWINDGETDKNNKLIKLDPIIFRNSYDLRGKKLKEIYSQATCIKEKSLNKNHNLNIIKNSKGIKNIKLNFTFEQALSLFYYKKVNKNVLLGIIQNIQENEKNINEINIIKGLKGIEEYLNAKCNNKDSVFKNKLEKKLIKIREKFLANEN